VVTSTILFALGDHTRRWLESPSLRKARALCCCCWRIFRTCVNRRDDWRPYPVPHPYCCGALRATEVLRHLPGHMSLHDVSGWGSHIPNCTSVCLKVSPQSIVLAAFDGDNYLSCNMCWLPLHPMALGAWRILHDAMRVEFIIWRAGQHRICLCAHPRGDNSRFARSRSPIYNCINRRSSHTPCRDSSIKALLAPPLADAVSI
jgi:hypothetical protein